MRDLIPERRTDKNGVESIRWIRRSPFGRTAPSYIPAPSLGEAVSSPAFRVDRSEIAVCFSRSKLKHTSFAIDDLNPGAAQAICWMMQSANHEGMLWRADSLVRTAFDGIAANVTAPDVQDDSGVDAPFNNLAVFGPVLLHPRSNNSPLKKLVIGLREFYEVSDFLTGATDEQREQAVALVTVVSRIEWPLLKNTGIGENSGFAIASPELAAFIMERPELADDIVRVMQDRQTDNVDVIRDVLGFETKVLSDGVL